MHTPSLPSVPQIGMAFSLALALVLLSTSSSSLVEAAPQGPSFPQRGWTTMDLGGNDAITAIAEVPDGRVFLGVRDDGLRVYAPDENGIFAWSAIHHQPRLADGLIHDSVRALAVLGDQLWIGTSGAGISLLHLQTGAWTTLNAANSGLPSDTVHHLSLAPQAPGGIWVSTDAGAARAHPVSNPSAFSWTVYDTSDGLPSNHLFDVAEQQVGPTTLLWFATAAGLSRWNGSTWKHYHNGDPVEGSCLLGRARRLALTSSNVLWMIAERYVPGFLIEAPETWSDRIHSPDAGEWVYQSLCTYRSWSRQPFFEESAHLPKMGPAEALAVDEADRVWTAFRGSGPAKGGAVVHDDGTWGVHRFPTATMMDAGGTAIAAFGDGLWLGHFDRTAISRYTPHWAQRILLGNGGGTFAVDRVFVEPDRMWVGLQDSVSMRAEGDSSWTTKSLPGGISGPIADFTRDPDGQLWLATVSGRVVRVQESPSSFLLTPDTVPGPGSDSVILRALTSDAKGHLWAAGPQGLFLRAEGYWMHVDAANSGLPSDQVTDLVLAADQSLWVATADAGIGVLSLGPEAPGKWTKWTVADGLPSDDIRELSVHGASEVWAATAQGVARFDVAAAQWSRRVEWPPESRRAHDFRGAERAGLGRPRRWIERAPGRRLAHRARAEHATRQRPAAAGHHVERSGLDARRGRGGPARGRARPHRRPAPGHRYHPTEQGQPRRPRHDHRPPLRRRPAPSQPRELLLPRRSVGYATTERPGDLGHRHGAGRAGAAGRILRYDRGHVPSAEHHVARGLRDRAGHQRCRAGLRGGRRCAPDLWLGLHGSRPRRSLRHHRQRAGAHRRRDDALRDQPAHPPGRHLGRGASAAGQWRTIHLGHVGHHLDATGSRRARPAGHRGPADGLGEDDHRPGDGLRPQPRPHPRSLRHDRRRSGPLDLRRWAGAGHPRDQRGSSDLTRRSALRAQPTRPWSSRAPSTS